MSPPHRGLAALLATSVLTVSAACGARWSDDQRAEVRQRGQGPATGQPGPAAAIAGSTEPTDVAGGAPTGGSTPGGRTDQAIGRAAGTTGGAASGPLPCAAASDAPGVTDDEITIGTISSLTGPVPGLGANAEATVRAHIAYRNAAGGVCGRKVVARTGDDGTDNGRFRSLVIEMEPRVLGFAGGFAAGDPGGTEVVGELEVPLVGTPQSQALTNVSTVFDLFPPFPDLDAVTAKYRYLYDQGVRRAAIVFIGVEQSRAEAMGSQKPLMEAAGIQVVNVQDLPISTLSYDSAARAVANSTADYLYFQHDQGSSAAMARALYNAGYKPKFAEYLTAYGSSFIELAGPGAEGATSWIRTLPKEDGPSANRELATFLEWLERAAPGTNADLIAADAWAGTKVFLDSLEALPGPISREALVNQFRSIDRYDADGFIGPIRFGSKQNLGCMVAMQVVNGRWQRLTPSQGFLC